MEPSTNSFTKHEDLALLLAEIVSHISNFQEQVDALLPDISERLKEWQDLETTLIDLRRGIQTLQRYAHPDAAPYFNALFSTIDAWARDKLFLELCKLVLQYPSNRRQRALQSIIGVVATGGSTREITHKVNGSLHGDEKLWTRVKKLVTTFLGD